MINVPFKISCFTLFSRKMLQKGLPFLHTKRNESSGVTLETLNFDDKVLKRLPIDDNKENAVRKVEGACYSKVTPCPVTNPQLVSYSTSALELLDISANEAARKEFISYFSGNSLLPGSTPLAHCYCGHQFGRFAGQLGDGAAITLGTIINKKKERWEIQLKGAGLTPYSRTADGRKVLRSSIREFLCSEAMYFLNTPTTRASSIITSDTKVVRDVFYDGNPILERCSIVCRLAPSFIRFGSFEICRGADRMTNNYGPSVAHSYILNQLADYVIETFYPEIWEHFQNNKPKMYEEFLSEVVIRTARLVAHWQSIGWCHGVLNTDNMSILGFTIDYGPYGFLDHYDPHYVPNASDTKGRYMFKNQPAICKWNCSMLANSLQGLIPDSRQYIDKFDDSYDKCYLEIMRKKLGLLTEHVSDKQLIDDLLETMNNTGTDYTNTFVCLSHLHLMDCPTCDGDDDCNTDKCIKNVKELLLQQCPPANEMITYYKTKLDVHTLCCHLELLRSDIPPELAQIMQHQKDQLLMEEYKMNRGFYFEDKSIEKTERDNNLWTTWLHKYVARLKLDCQQMDGSFEGSCVDQQSNVDVDTCANGGKEQLKKLDEKRSQLMKSVNPRFIPRNYIVQQAIDEAELGNYSLVNNILKRIERPFEDDQDDYELVNVKTDCSIDSGNEPVKLLNGCMPNLRRHPKQSPLAMLT